LTFRSDFARKRFSFYRMKLNKKKEQEIKDALVKYNQRKEGEKHIEAMYGERKKKRLQKEIF